MSGTQTDNVARLYGNIVDYEQTRLATHPMEREITLLTIKQYLGPTSKVADIGGGPGVISFTLADQGHSVDLRDLTPELIQIAQQTQEKRRTENKPLLNSIGVSNALDKSGLPEENFDAVLLLGPLYHLMNESERVTAVRNALDLVKKGGVLVCAFITVAAHLRDVAMRDARRVVKDADFYAKYVGAPFTTTL